MPRAKKKPSLNFLKCLQCRRDRQKCVPTERIWPDRCDRCKKFNYACSENQSKEAEKRKCLQNDDSPSLAKRLKYKTIEEHLEDLGYLGRLSTRLQDLAETKDLDGAAFHGGLPNDLAKNVDLALDIATADGQIQVELLRAAKKHSEALILHQRLSNIRRPIPFLDHYSISNYETLVLLSESVGDYAAAEEYQECMLLQEQVSWLNHPEPDAAERTLSRLIEISDQKLSTVATRWKIDPSLAFSVTLSPYRLFQSNKATLFSDQIKKIAQSSSQAILKRSLLNLAARYGCIQVFRLLLNSQGVFDNVTLDERFILLDTAARNGHTAILDELLAIDVHIEGGDQSDLGTALIQAAVDGNVKTAELLLELGANIEVVGGDGHKALYKAAAGGHEAVVKLLMEKEANIDAVSGDGWTALHSAAQNGHHAVIKLLLEKKPNIEAKDNDGWTALHRAARNGHDAVVKQLLEKGPDMEAEDATESTALHRAARNGHEVVVNLLLKMGASNEAEDSFGRTALHLGAAYGHKAVTKLLLEKGVNIESKDRLGRTALHRAAAKGYEALVKLLMEKGANTDAVSGDGWTALHLAARNGHDAVVKLLAGEGTNIEVGNSYGEMDLHWPSSYEQEALVRLL